MRVASEEEVISFSAASNSVKGDVSICARLAGCGPLSLLINTPVRNERTRHLHSGIPSVRRGAMTDGSVSTRLGTPVPVRLTSSSFGVGGPPRDWRVRGKTQVRVRVHIAGPEMENVLLATSGPKPLWHPAHWNRSRVTIAPLSPECRQLWKSRPSLCVFYHYQFPLDPFLYLSLSLYAMTREYIYFFLLRAQLQMSPLQRWKLQFYLFTEPALVRV